MRDREKERERQKEREKVTDTGTETETESIRTAGRNVTNNHDQVKDTCDFDLFH